MPGTAPHRLPVLSPCTFPDQLVFKHPHLFPSHSRHLDIPAVCIACTFYHIRKITRFRETWLAGGRCETKTKFGEHECGRPEARHQQKRPTQVPHQLQKVSLHTPMSLYTHGRPSGPQRVCAFRLDEISGLTFMGDDVCQVPGGTWHTSSSMKLSPEISSSRNAHTLW